MFVRNCFAINISVIEKSGENAKRYSEFDLIGIYSLYLFLVFIVWAPTHPIQDCCRCCV